CCWRVQLWPDPAKRTAASLADFAGVTRRVGDENKSSSRKRWASHRGARSLKIGFRYKDKENVATLSDCNWRRSAILLVRPHVQHMVLAPSNLLSVPTSVC